MFEPPHPRTSFVERVIMCSSVQVSTRIKLQRWQMLLVVPAADQVVPLD